MAEPSPPGMITTLPIRPPPRMPSAPPAVVPQRSQTYTAPPDYHHYVTSPMRDDASSYSFDRMSVMTDHTWASGTSASTNMSGGSSIYTFNDDMFSNPRSSSISSISSTSGLSHYSFQPHRSQQYSSMQSQFQGVPTQIAKHDPFTGLWNDSLRVIPCRRDHSYVMWHDDSFTSCLICGFSRWHALMLSAREMSLDMFSNAMQHLRDVNRVDFAGNYPIHFLMTAGVAMDYFFQLYKWPNSSAQNVFGQNPLHVLNPRDLGESLIHFLDWFKTREQPPGLLLTQRDIYGKTPLHTLFQHPLERHLYVKVLKVFPYAEHQLRSLDTSGRPCMQMMYDASLRLKDQNPQDFERMQAGIAEVNGFLSQAAITSTEPPGPKYGFHDIARGARGTSYFGFFQCKICYSGDLHSNSYIDQMKCACANGRDRNAPDESGMTPAHALLTHSRANNNPELTPESPAQIAELLEVLIPRDDPTMREALHVLDPEGHTLVWNAAIRGLDTALAYILSAEEAGRRRAMVNAVGISTTYVDVSHSNTPDPAGGMSSHVPYTHSVPQTTEVSILEAVVIKLRKVREDLKTAEMVGDRRVRRSLATLGNSLLNVRKILIANGAVVAPGPTMKWKINWWVLWIPLILLCYKRQLYGRSSTFFLTTTLIIGTFINHNTYISILMHKSSFGSTLRVAYQHRHSLRPTILGISFICFHDCEGFLFPS